MTTIAQTADALTDLASQLQKQADSLAEREKELESLPVLVREHHDRNHPLAWQICGSQLCRAVQ